MDEKTEKFALVLDIGTTGIKSFVFNEAFGIVAKSYKHIDEINLHRGHVEQDPRDILKLAIEAIRDAVKNSGILTENILGMAITNQRESVVAWDKKTSWPFYPAILWKDVRTEEYCARFSDADRKKIKQKTGLSIEPYFSASKINWLLNNVPEVKTAMKENCLACGTLDSWLLWNISEEKNFLTDQTNASRALLFNIREKKWDEDLFEFFEIPREIVSEVYESKSNFGNLKKEIIGRTLPIVGICGDQQASLYAAGKTIGTTKITYGTGTFIMQITGKEFVLNENFFTTLSVDGDYVFEAKVNHGGEEVELILNDNEKLLKYLKNLAQETDFYVKKLPQKPAEIIIDGGVMRDGILKKYQEEISQVSIKEQMIFDGTALGAAKLVFEQ